jgi:GH43 family beta-xylosidase
MVTIKTVYKKEKGNKLYDKERATKSHTTKYNQTGMRQFLIHPKQKFRAIYQT